MDTRVLIVCENRGLNELLIIKIKRNKTIGLFFWKEFTHLNRKQKKEVYS